MTWVKLDDQFPTDPKIVGLPPTAVTLYVFGLCYSSANLTDGYVPDAVIATWGVNKWRAAADVLCAPPRSRVGQGSDEVETRSLWSRLDHGYQIHNYLLHQRSAAEVKKLRETRATAGSKGGKAKASRSTLGKQTPSKVLGEALAETEAETEPSSSPPVTDTRRSADLPNPEDEDFVERTLTATFDLMAEQTLDRVRAEGQTVHNAAGWKRKAAANFAETHLEAALHYLGNRTAGRYYDLHVELAEQLDPRCGPADGGAKRAEQQRLATLHQLHPDQGAA